MANASNTVNELRNDAQNMTGRLTDTAHDAVDRVAAKAAPTIDRLGAQAAGLADKVQSKVEDFGAMQEEWVESARDMVRERPLATLGTVLLVGILLGRWVR